MNPWLFGTALFALLSGPATAATPPSQIGIVLMHGKAGEPTGKIAPLARVLRAHGYLVATPAMPWSKERIYDKSYEDSLLEIDRDFEGLRAQGARVLIVAGHSLGGNVALGYFARRPEIAGLIALAPGHEPDSPSLSALASPGLQRAYNLIAADRPNEWGEYPDAGAGAELTVKATPLIYLSWFSPKGPAVLEKSVRAIHPARPIFMAVGTRDALAPLDERLYKEAPADPLSRCIKVDADHLEVPAAAADAVLEWLRRLAAEQSFSADP